MLYCYSMFHEGSQVQQTPEEGWRTYRLKRCGNNNKDEDNSMKTLNDKNHQASSQKFRQLIENNQKVNKINEYVFLCPISKHRKLGVHCSNHSLFVRSFIDKKKVLQITRSKGKEYALNKIFQLFLSNFTPTFFWGGVFLFFIFYIFKMSFF